MEIFHILNFLSVKVVPVPSDLRLESALTPCSLGKLGPCFSICITGQYRYPHRVTLKIKQQNKHMEGLKDVQSLSLLSWKQNAQRKLCSRGHIYCQDVLIKISGQQMA